MENGKKVDASKDLFVIHSDEINRAYDRAVREALLKHKLAGNPVPVERDGEIVYLQPDDIDATSAE